MGDLQIGLASARLKKNPTIIFHPPPFSAFPLAPFIAQSVADTGWNAFLESQNR